MSNDDIIARATLNLHELSSKQIERPNCAWLVASVGAAFTVDGTMVDMVPEPEMEPATSTRERVARAIRGVDGACVGCMSRCDDLEPGCCAYDYADAAIAAMRDPAPTTSPCPHCGKPATTSTCGIGGCPLGADL